MKRFIVTIFLCLYAKMLLYAQPIEAETILSLKELPPAIRKEWKKGVPAIIEVFSSFCSTSFTSLPLLKKMKAQFGNEIQFFLIGKKDKTIEDTYQQFATWYDLDFGVVMDSIFPNKINTGYLPTFIWVNNSGKIVALTGNLEVSNSNIELFLKGNPIERKTFQPDNVLTGFLKNYQHDTNFLFRSELTNWTKTDPVATPFAVDFDKNYFQALGVTLKQLYFFAFCGKRYWSSTDSLYEHFSRLIIFESTQGNPAIDMDKAYNYRIVFKERPAPEDYLKYIQDDLNRALPYTAKMERRLMPYWRLIIPDGDTSRIASRHTETKGTVTQAAVDLTNHPLWPLIESLQVLYVQDQPIIDETGVKGYVDIKFRAVLSDRDALRNGLRQAGLDLVQGSKWMDVIVITPKETKVAIKR